MVSEELRGNEENVHNLLLVYKMVLWRSPEDLSDFSDFPSR